MSLFRSDRKVLVIALLSSLATAAIGCRHLCPIDRDDDVRPKATKLQTVSRSKWLELVSVEPRSRHCSGVDKLDGPMYAVVSYPGSSPPKLYESYIYDNALALLWYTWTGRMKLARRIARTLICLQNAEGSWGFSFRLVGDHRYRRDYIRSGAVAWAIHALRIFALKEEGEKAKKAARRGYHYLAWQRVDRPSTPIDGLILARRKNSRGNPPEDGLVVAEHQFISEVVLSQFDPAEGRALADRLVEHLWLPSERRFAVAANLEELDPRAALDSSGALGALWLLARGEKSRARASYEYASERFEVSGPCVDGFRPYVSALDDYPASAEPHIFVEGTMSMGLAALRLGRKQLARRLLEAGRQMNIEGTPGLVYSNRTVGQFPAIPAAAPTIWYLFLKRELETSESAPIF